MVTTHLTSGIGPGPAPENRLRILTVNAGSSSLKLALIGPVDETLGELELPAPLATEDGSQLRGALSEGLGQADAVGHRIVHGGRRFREAVRIDGGVEAALRDLTELAPLHQPKSLAALGAVARELPDIPAFACFDTAFHSTIPAPAATYALPRAWRERWDLQRYGFHGLSHAWVARRAPEFVARPRNELRIVSCHLGAGASLCAINGGSSIDTTMGFTPLEGLVMATRSGSVDPGLLLWLLERTGLSERELARALEHESGLLGIAGTPDMREVLERAAVGEPLGALALQTYLHRLQAGIGAMAASLGGLDALVFTGGVGEHSPEIRARTVAGLRFLGLALDDTRNQTAARDDDLTAPGARARTLVLRAREDLEIAHQVRSALA